MPSAQGVRSTAHASCGCSAPRICRVSRNGVSSGMGSTCAPVPNEYLHQVTDAHLHQLQTSSMDRQRPIYCITLHHPG